MYIFWQRLGVPQDYLLWVFCILLASWQNKGIFWQRWDVPQDYLLWLFCILLASCQNKGIFWQRLDVPQDYLLWLFCILSAEKPASKRLSVAVSAWGKIIEPRKGKLQMSPMSEQMQWNKTPNSYFLKV